MPGDRSSTTTKSTEPDPSPEDQERQEADLKENGGNSRTDGRVDYTEEDEEVKDEEVEEDDGSE